MSPDLNSNAEHRIGRECRVSQQRITEKYGGEDANCADESLKTAGSPAASQATR